MQVQRAVDGLARSGIGQERDYREVRSPQGPALPMPLPARGQTLAPLKLLRILADVGHSLAPLKLLRIFRGHAGLRE
jgi:hypothetical protein